MQRSASRIWPLAALLWIAFIIVGVGPLLMEQLDQRGMTGRVFGLPVFVTETIVIGLVALVPVGWFRRRTR